MNLNKKRLQKLLLAGFIFGVFAFFKTHLAFAESNSEADLEYFLEGVGDFLINKVGPAVLVIGVCVAGAGMALGDHLATQRGFLAAVGGALILLSRAVLDLIQRITNF